LTTTAIDRLASRASALPSFVVAAAIMLHAGQASASAKDKIETAIQEAKETMLVDPAAAVSNVEAIHRQLDLRPVSPAKERQLATAEWLQGEALIRLGREAEAAPLIESAWRRVSQIDPESDLAGDILLSRGGVHSSRAEVANALEDYQRSYKVFRKTGETRKQTIALLSIASLYKDANSFKDALKYYRQAEELYNPDPKLRVSVLNNIAGVYKELGNYDETRKRFQLALEIARSLRSEVLEALIWRNIARSELAAGQLVRADEAVQQSMAVSRRLGPETMVQAWSVAAQYSLQRGDLVTAERQIEHAFAGVDVAKTTVPFLDAHRTAYEIYKRLGRPAQALAHLQSLKRLDDETAKLAASANTALLAARFDFANQDLKIAKLRRAEAQRSLELERSRAQFQRTVFGGAAVATAILLALLSFGLVTIRRSRNEVRAANIDLASTNVALEKALAAKTEFLATTSHEIRTPLNGILGMTQVMLADDKLPPSTRDRISVVHGAGVTMRALVDDILDVAKMETGNMTLEHVPVDLPATMRDVCRMWQEQAQARGLGFDLQLADAPRLIMGDPARLRQIVFNLLSNALKFTSEGAVTVKVTAAEDRYRVAVSDTGIGIPADKLDLIFESFRQVDAGTTRKYGGTGLGLAICRNLAEAMGGTVTVESAVGAGSTFTIDLPLERCAESPAPAETEAASRALVVDRNPITRSMLKTLLLPHTAVVEAFGSVPEAVSALADCAATVVLVDQGALPVEEDPRPVLAGLAEAAARYDGHVTVLWAAPDADLLDWAAAQDALDIVTKPIAGAALVGMLYPASGSVNESAGASQLAARAA